ncbi:MAG: TolC family protein [Rhodothermaceae bacterium]|nr:TolC family protein [Rhodothermaceae bacterium]MXZ58944.1 TolC family protein [Rhodothermaceae bacterium]MYB91796.1 TolC family protein [Rhodothermaceae bacterium]MYD68114.1 TolC family protein [Rhodothermaceae bacterium]MYG44599.1 TolC family protein [Rhodothermaceae bacterium]
MTNSVTSFSPQSKGGCCVGAHTSRWVRSFFVVGLLVTVGLVGCSMAPRLEDPLQPLPEEFEAAALADQSAQHYWWHGFGDPYLNQLVDSVIARNLDLRVAVARVAEVQNQFRIARSEQLPSMELAARRDQQDTPSNIGIGGQLGDRFSVPGAPEFPDRFDYTTYSASLGFAYEIDFWGRVRGTKRAALQEFFATQSDVRTVLMGVIGETVATYFEIAARQRTLELTQESVRILTERTEILSDRYERGLVSPLEFHAAQQQLHAAKADLPVLESQLDATRGRLSLLLGSYRMPMDTMLVPESAYTYALEEIPSGLPSDLLQGRPDVVAAFQRLEAARERIGAARAVQFPSFSLTGAAGTQSSTLSDIVKTSQNFWLFGTGLTAPIFNAGRIRANIRVAWAQYEQLALQYEKTVLMAFRDVEAALVNYGKLKERHASLTAAQASAHDRVQIQELRYLRGTGDYLGFLDARRNLVLSEIGLMESRRSLAEARLAVHRSLGGTWIQEGSVLNPETP